MLREMHYIKIHFHETTLHYMKTAKDVCRSFYLIPNVCTKAFSFWFLIVVIVSVSRIYGFRKMTMTPKTRQYACNIGAQCNNRIIYVTKHHTRHRCGRFFASHSIYVLTSNKKSEKKNMFEMRKMKIASFTYGKMDGD